MSAPTPTTLKVPGATLFYEQRGAGPTLLLIPAGAGDAESYQALADQLAADYTVITYDRRGYSRSTLDDPGQPISIATHSDDVHRLLSAVSTAPANVFGCSIGAIIGLDAALRYPAQLRRLVAHEPQINALLPAAEQAELRQRQQALIETLRREGPAAALQKFSAELGIARGDPRRRAGLTQLSSETAARNQAVFFKYDVGAVAGYTLDLAALTASPVRLVVAGGSTGREYAPYHSAAALAERLGLSLVEFPGNHAGFVDCPVEFAARLREVVGN